MSALSFPLSSLLSEIVPGGHLGIQSIPEEYFNTKYGLSKSWESEMKNYPQMFK